MTVASLFHDIMFLGVLLLVGFIVREFVRPLQKLFIPASVIGGVIALLLGPQVLGFIAIPKSFGSLSSVLINLIMTAIVFGISVGKGRLRTYADFTLVISATYGAQMAAGVLVGMGLCHFWPDLPKGWGLMGVYSFWGGHGTAAAAGALFKDLGEPDNYGMGMILATVGLISAIVVGMVIVNWGIRTGKTRYFTLAHTSDDSVYRGPLPPQKRQSLGVETVSSTGINSLALQFCLLMVCIFLGDFIFSYVKQRFGLTIPSIVHGMVGAFILWPAMIKLKLSAYCDKRSINTLSNFTLELVICSAVATLPLNLVTAFFVPILVFSLVIVGLAVFLNLYMASKVSRDDWFEKAVTAYGEGTGNTATGLALLRCADPELKSSASDACGVGTSLFSPVYGLMPAIGPILLMQSEWNLVGIGAGIFVAAVTLGRLFFWQQETRI